jgi:hypothetical protein
MQYVHILESRHLKPSEPKLLVRWQGHCRFERDYIFRARYFELEVDKNQLQIDRETTLMSEVHLTFISSFSTTNINYLLRLSNLDDCFFAVCFFFAKEPAKTFFLQSQIFCSRAGGRIQFFVSFLAVFVVQGRVINLL